MKKIMRSVKETVMQFTPIELKVRAATNNDRFLVSASHLAEIARATNDYQEYPPLFAMLWKRLTDLEHVMHVQKALHVVEYCLRHGAERFINDAKRRARDIAALQKYKHYDEMNQDDAKEARARAKAVYALLMDDQLLAQERGKSARLASEGRLAGGGAGGYDNHELEAAYGRPPRGSASGNGGGGQQRSRAGSYDDGYSGDDFNQRASAPAAAPVRRSAAPAAAAAPSARSGGALRRRSLEEDPFENPVIPSAVTGPPVQPRVRTAAATNGHAAAPAPKRATAAAAASAPAKAARAAAPAPAAAEEEEEEEDEEAAAKRAKKEKKKAKKEAAAAAEAAAQRAAQQQQQQQDPFGSSSSQGGGRAAASSFDLSGYVDDTRGRGAGGAGGEFDLLSGGGGAPAYDPSQPGEDALEELFASSTLTDEQVSSPHTHYHASGNPFRSPEPPGHDGDGNLSCISGNSGGGHGAPGQALSPTNALVNLTDITAPAKQPSSTNVDAGVSMSMMRSIQPLGAPASASSTPINGGMNNAHKRSNIPASVPMHQQHPHAFAQQGAPLLGMQQQQQQQAANGFMYGGPALGPPMAGYGAPMHHMQQGGQQHPGMMMYPGGGMGMGGGGYGAPQQPMLAILPPGMSNGPALGGGPPMMQYGGGAPAANYGHLPASSPSHMTFTQMRQAPSKQSHSTGPIIFDVPRAADSQQQQQQQHNMQQQQQQQQRGQPMNNQPQYQSYYGQSTASQNNIHF